MSRSSCGGEPAPTSGVGPGVTNAPSRTRPTDGPFDHRLRRTRGRHDRRASERRRAISENHVPTDANEAFAQLGRIVFGEQPLDRILEQVVHIAKKVIPTPVEVSITLIADDKPFTVAFTDPSAVELDERQYETERGPCLDAAASGQLISIPYTSAETRWPRFTQTAAENGVASTLSVPLPVQRQVTGALNFYASEPAAFSDEIVELAQTFAAHAAVAAANAHLYESTAALAEQMKQAMATRAVIEQAKGIIIRDLNCSPDEAFDALVRLSQETHYKLRDVAQRLVEHVSGGGSASSFPVK